MLLLAGSKARSWLGGRHSQLRQFSAKSFHRRNLLSDFGQDGFVQLMTSLARPGF
jgi:hypothetical protein